MWLVLLAQWKFGPTRPRALLRGSATSITILSFMLLGATASAQSKAAEPPTGTVHVDVTPGHAINSFDPDTALGSSIDVLSRTGIDRVYTPHIIQEALSAGWDPSPIAIPSSAWPPGTGQKTEPGATPPTRAD